MEVANANQEAIFYISNVPNNRFPISPAKPHIYNTRHSPQKLHKNLQEYSSPFRNGKKSSNYISPTFMSGDCFYPHIVTPTNQQTFYQSQSKTPSKINSPSATPHHERKTSLYDQYLKRQTNSKSPQVKRDQSYDTQTIRKIQIPMEVQTNLFSNQPSSPSNADKMSIKTESIRHAHHLPDSNKHQPNRNQTPVRQSLQIKQSASRTPTKDFRERPQSNTFVFDQPPQHTFHDAQSPPNNYFNSTNQQSSPKSASQKSYKSTSISLVTQQICPNCFNEDLVDHHHQAQRKEREKDKALLDKNVDYEKKLINYEIDQEISKREKEKQLLGNEYREFRKKQEFSRQQAEREKEYDRQLENMRKEIVEQTKKEEQDQQIQKRLSFLKGIEQQLAEREQMRQEERKKLQQLSSTQPGIIDIGEEFKAIPQHVLNDKFSIDVNQVLKDIKKQKQLKVVQDMQEIRKKQLMEKQRQQESTKLQEKEYAMKLKEMNELQQKREQLEQLQRKHKKQVLTKGLDEQLSLKRHNQQIRQERERDYEKQLNIFDATTEPPKTLQYNNCDGCDKQYLKEYLARVKRPRDKLKHQRY